MNLTAVDSLYGVAVFLLNTVFFVVLQGVTIRFLHPRRLLASSAAVFVGSTTLLFIIIYGVAGQYFPSSGAFLGLALFILVTNFGLCGLYTFLGPATADRSATVHLLLYLDRHGGSATAADVHTAFASALFVEKRLAECVQARIIRTEQQSVTMTRRGMRLARIFSAMRGVYDLQRLPRHSLSFRDKGLS